MIRTSTEGSVLNRPPSTRKHERYLFHLSVGTSKPVAEEIFDSKNSDEKTYGWAEVFHTREHVLLIYRRKRDTTSALISL